MSNIVDPKVLEVMKNNHLCVLSTISPEGAPQSALVGFAEDDNGWLVIGTSTLSRKFKNITNDERVSGVIGGWEDGKTIQFEGMAYNAKGDEWLERQALHVAKYPVNMKFKDEPDQTYIVIKPTWLRLTDASDRPWKITEWQA